MKNAMNVLIDGLLEFKTEFEENVPSHLQQVRISSVDQLEEAPPIPILPKSSIGTSKTASSGDKAAEAARR